MCNWEKVRRLVAEKDYTDPGELSEEEGGGGSSEAGASFAADGAGSDSTVSLD